MARSCRCYRRTCEQDEVTGAHDVVTVEQDNKAELYRATAIATTLTS